MLQVKSNERLRNLNETYEILRRNLQRRFKRMTIDRLWIEYGETIRRDLKKNYFLLSLSTPEGCDLEVWITSIFLLVILESKKYGSPILNVSYFQSVRLTIYQNP